jgi:peroxiredoxin
VDIFPHRANETMKTRFLPLLLLLAAVADLSAAQAGMAAAQPGMPAMAEMSAPMMGMAPPMGAMAPNFTLKTLDDRSIELQKLTAQAPVVLVVLRGWPGYNCPNCTLQVHDFVQRAAEFRAQNVQVLMVYPGPAEALKAHAQEFLQDKAWPKDFLLVLDPSYAFTNQYGLRWDAPNETAYPSTFVLDREGKVRFAKISRVHGDRVPAATVLEQVRMLK